MARHNEWGKEAERIAAEYLIKEGYTIREQNWRPTSSHKEIDIITQRGGTIVFVEVKARHDTGCDPAEAIDSKKIRFLANAAASYLNRQQFDFEYRFDIITITGTPDDYSLDHIEDAFLPPLTTR